MANGQIDLLKLFQAAAGALQQNQSSLNQADTYNHDHGDNMVNTFDTIIQALQQKQNAKPAAQLKYVGQQLEQTATSGSGKTYAQGFAQAAAHFKGTEITLESILPLIQLLLGGGQATTSKGSSADIIGSILGGLSGGSSGQSGQGLDLGGLLGGLLGGQNSSTASQSGQAGSLGGLLGGLLGGQNGSSGNAGGDLLGSLIGGLVGNSKMADSAPHTQSGQIVAGSILQALSQLLGQ
jgi:hypothetical protein